jgi:hypothetical protein
LPLDILVILVVIGISSVVLLTWALGWARPVKLKSPDEGKEQFLQDHPECSVEEVYLATDGLTALLGLSDAKAGLVFSFGDKFVTRRLSADMVRTIEVAEQDAETSVTLRLADFTTPTIKASFADGHVKSLLQSMSANSKAA